MSRKLLLVPLLLSIVACGGEVGISELDPDAEEEPDYSMYEGATLRIVEPSSASFLPWGDSHRFVAEVTAEDGTLLDEVEDISWDSSADPAWQRTGATFDDDEIDVGLHDLTAEVTLPNGDRLAHTVGGVLVQHEDAGTYVGTFSASMVFQQLPIACAGSAVLMIEPYGKEVSGEATCLAQAGNFELPLDFTVEATNDEGDLDGMATARIIAFDVDFDAEGELPGDETLTLEFGGPVFTTDLTGKVEAKRISRDAGL